MRHLLLFPLFAIVLFSCNQQEKKQPEKKNKTTDFIISKDGIKDLKIGMTQDEVEKLLGQKFSFNAMKDSVGYWSDTVDAKYNNLDVSLYFERQYSEDDNGIYTLYGVSTKSDLCTTSSGIGIGDTKADILPEYEDNPINMGPEWEQVNDSTWAMSKSKYSINVKDDKYDKELIFHLVNKKVTSLEAAIIMGD